MLVLVNLQFLQRSSDYFVMKCSNLPSRCGPGCLCFTLGVEELSECKKVHFVALYHFFLSGREDEFPGKCDVVLLTFDNYKEQLVTLITVFDIS